VTVSLGTVHSPSAGRRRQTAQIYALLDKNILSARRKDPIPRPAKNTTKPCLPSAKWKDPVSWA